MVGDDGAKLENFTAMSLLKHVYDKNDYLAEAYSLYYIRTLDKKEVDFALVKDDKIEMIIEAKLSEHEIDKTLYYFCNKYNLSGVQVVKNLKIDYKKEKIKIIKADKFLETLYL